MHPPIFRTQQRLSDWPECFLHLHCPACRKPVIYPVAMLRAECGDVTFEALLPRLKCKECGTRPAPIYLCATHIRTFSYGGPPQWSVELRSALDAKG